MFFANPFYVRHLPAPSIPVRRECRGIFPGLSTLSKSAAWFQDSIALDEQRKNWPKNEIRKKNQQAQHSTLLHNPSRSITITFSLTKSVENTNIRDLSDDFLFPCSLHIKHLRPTTEEIFQQNNPNDKIRCSGSADLYSATILASEPKSGERRCTAPPFWLQSQKVVKGGVQRHHFGFRAKRWWKAVYSATILASEPKSGERRCTAPPFWLQSQKVVKGGVQHHFHTIL